MKKSKLLSLLFAVIMAVFTFTLCCTSAVFAAADKTLILNCRRDDTVISGMEWKIYRIGQRNREGKIVLTGDFADYSIDFSDLTSESLGTAAKTLEAYAAADKIVPTASGITDAEGLLSVSGLDAGIYLASGSTVTLNKVVYIPSALIMETEEDKTSLEYDAYPKFSYTTDSGEMQTYSVKKVWVGDENCTEARPVSVTVELYKDSTLFNTVILDETNDWTYSWEGLAADSKWYAVERNIPTDYEVSVENNMTQFLIRNTYAPPQPPPPTTTAVSTEVTAVTTPSDASSENTTAVITNERTTTTAPPPSSIAASKTPKPPVNKLPQTGQLWWPVPILSLGGFLMIGVGLRIGKKDEDQ